MEYRSFRVLLQHTAHCARSNALEQNMREISTHLLLSASTGCAVHDELYDCKKF